MAIDNTTSGVSTRNVLFGEGPNPASNGNPIDTQLMSDSAAAAFWRRVQADYTFLSTTAYTQLGQIDTDWRRLDDQLHADTTRTLQYKAEQGAAIRSAALKLIADLLATAQAKRDAIDAACDAAQPAPVAKDATAQLLAVTARDGAWQRMRMRLDGATTSQNHSSSTAFSTMLDMVNRAVRDGDEATVQAARYYGSAYLAQFGGAGLDDASIGAAIDTAEAPNRPPVARAALQVKEALRIGWPRLASAITMTRQMAGNPGYPRVAELPGWDGNPTRISQYGL